MLPILYRTPWFFIYSYTAVLSIGVLAGMAVTKRIARDGGWVDGYLAAFAAALIGGRVGFILMEWGYYQERPLTFQNLWQGVLWQGGFNYHAALLAGIVGVWIYSWWGKRLAYTLTLFAPAFALITAFGWLACWLEGCGYGAETVLKEGIGALFVADLPDNFGIFMVRYQTQWLGFLYSLLIFLLALRLEIRFWHVLLLISLGRIGIGFLRGDPITHFGGLRLDILLDIVLALLCLILLQYTAYETKNRIGTDSSPPR